MWCEVLFYHRRVAERECGVQNMSRLIDADALKERILKERDAIPTTIVERYSLGVPTPNNHGNSMRGGIRIALRCMEQTPTIDAVEVVRCKDCKQNLGIHGDFIECGYWLDIVKPNGFCSYGERRDSNG